MKLAKKIAILAIVIYDAVCVYGYFSTLGSSETVRNTSCNTPDGQVANCGTMYFPHWAVLMMAFAWTGLIGLVYWANRKGIDK